jgi:hypothetical protein
MASVERNAVAQRELARPAAAPRLKTARATAPAASAEEPGFMRVSASMDKEQAQSQHATGWIILTVFEQRTVVGPQGTVVADYAIEQEGRNTVLNSESEKKIPAQKIDAIPLARIGEDWVVWDL